MTKFSSSFKSNEIHIVDSPFDEDTKYTNFFREAQLSGKGRLENLGKWAITRTSIVMQIGVVNFEREYQSLPLVPKSL